MLKMLVERHPEAAERGWRTPEATLLASAKRRATVPRDTTHPAALTFEAQGRKAQTENRVRQWISRVINESVGEKVPAAQT